MASSVNTGITGLSATAIEPLVLWALNGFKGPIPDDVPLLIATMLCAAGHAIYNVVVARLPKPPEGEVK